MSDNFYDFDKDDAFDEVYLNGTVKRPPKKEYEIEIPMPKSNIKTTMPPSPAPKKKAKSVKQKPLSPTALCFSIIGIALSCVLVFVGSTLAVIFGWRYLPDSDKEDEQSVVENVEQIEEYVEISDDGTTVEVVPMYRETEGDDAPPSSGSENSEDEADDPDSENTENAENGEDAENSESGDTPADSEDEIINIE